MRNVKACLLGMLAIMLLLVAAPLARAQSGDKDMPRYVVDPSWPKPLPNNWILGQVGALHVDSHDNIWVFNRPRSLTVDELGAAANPPRSVCCFAAPSVLEFDSKGNVIRSWGAPGFVPDWPINEHGIWVDREGNVWLSGSGVGDRQVLKFTPDGKLIMEIGHSTVALNKAAPPAAAAAARSQEAAAPDPATANLGRSATADPRNNQDTALLGKPANMEVDDAAHEIYIADGYLNNRVVVYDSNTGKFKRGWGAYGVALSEVSNADQPPYKYVAGAKPDKEFRNPVHCVRLSTDGLVYVCDRSNDRIQVFTKEGKFVKEFILRPITLGNGCCMSVAFSHDPQQKYLLIADAENGFISVVRRSDGVIAGEIGHKGRDAGQFNWVHTISMDSQGNIYTGEVNTGKRVQKFILQK